MKIEIEILETFHVVEGANLWDASHYKRGSGFYKVIEGLTAGDVQEHFVYVTGNLSVFLCPWPTETKEIEEAPEVESQAPGAVSEEFVLKLFAIEKGEKYQSLK